MNGMKQKVKSCLRAIYHRLPPVCQRFAHRCWFRFRATYRQEVVLDARSQLMLDVLQTTIESHLRENERTLMALVKAVQMSNTGSVKPEFQLVSVGAHRILAGHPLLHFMYLDPHDLLVTPRVLQNTYEKKVYLALRRLVKPGSVVVEVGANQGFHTLTLGKLVSSGGGKVLSFESNPASFAILQDNVTAHQMGTTVLLFKKAAHLPNSKLKLHVPRSVAQIYPNANEENESEVEVETIRIGDVLKEHGIRPDFVRLDNEGAESLALDGMWEYVESSPEIRVMFEFNPSRMRMHDQSSPERFLTRLTEIGMCFRQIEEDGTLIPVQKDQILALPDNSWADIVAERKAS